MQRRQRWLIIIYTIMWTCRVRCVSSHEWLNNIQPGPQNNLVCYYHQCGFTFREFISWQYRGSYGSYKPWKPKGFFQFEIIINVLFSRFSYFRLIWIPMLWVYGHWKYFHPYSAGIDFRRHNLTSTDVRLWRLKSIPALWGLSDTAYVGPQLKRVNTRRQINQDRMIFGDFSINSKPIFFKFCKRSFFIQILTALKIS